jgi:hypothetical protein
MIFEGWSSPDPGHGSLAGQAWDTPSVLHILNIEVVVVAVATSALELFVKVETLPYL